MNNILTEYASLHQSVHDKYKPEPPSKQKIIKIAAELEALQKMHITANRSELDKYLLSYRPISTSSPNQFFVFVRVSAITSRRIWAYDNPVLRFSFFKFDANNEDILMWAGERNKLSAIASYINRAKLNREEDHIAFRVYRKEWRLDQVIQEEPGRKLYSIKFHNEIAKAEN